MFSEAYHVCFRSPASKAGCCCDTVWRCHQIKHFPRHWPFVRRIHRSPVDSLTKASDADIFFDLRLNKRLSKQSGRRWFETPLRSLWCHCNDEIYSSRPIVLKCCRVAHYGGALREIAPRLDNRWLGYGKIFRDILCVSNGSSLLHISSKLFLSLISLSPFTLRKQCII